MRGVGFGAIGVDDIRSCEYIVAMYWMAWNFTYLLYCLSALVESSQYKICMALASPAVPNAIIQSHALRSNQYLAVICSILLCTTN